MDILAWIVFGGLVGWVASLVMKTDAQQGILLNVIVGMLGAVIGGWIMGLLGISGVGGFTLYSFVVSLVGACVLIVLLKMVRR